jgi:hypothetical protein
MSLFITFFTYFNYTISKDWQEFHQESIILQKKLILFCIARIIYSAKLDYSFLQHIAFLE